MDGVAIAAQLARRVIFSVVMLVLIEGERHSVAPWRIWEKGTAKQTGTLIECWHDSSRYRSQARKGLLISRRDAILRDTTQLRSLDLACR